MTVAKRRFGGPKLVIAILVVGTVPIVSAYPLPMSGAPRSCRR